MFRWLNAEAEMSIRSEANEVLLNIFVMIIATRALPVRVAFLFQEARIENLRGSR
jgi:hypothetical protein